MPSIPLLHYSYSLRILLIIFSLLRTDLSAATSHTSNEAAEDVFKKVMLAVRVGPSTIQLRNHASVILPAEYAFIPEKEAAQVMELIGNPTGEHFLGLFTDSDVRLDWFVVARYAPEGYIKDDDAKDWDVDELLEGLQQGTEISNKFRKERGISEIEIVDWLDRPQYDERVHHLTYSVLIKEKEVAQGSDMTANWTTYLLGRKGYIDLTLVSGENEINDHKTYASAISSEFKFLEGKHYDDFNSNTDKVAAYGLAALIGGAAAKKLGLFAIIGVFLVKFAKVFIIAGLALAVGSFSFFKKFFRRE